MVTDPAVSYRPGRPEDVPALVDLLARCDATSAEWAPAGWVPPTTEPDGARLAERMADPGTGVTVAVTDEGIPVGFSTIRAGEEPGRGHVSNLFVDPRHWGAGIGRGLLARAEQEMRERGWSAADVSTQVLNARARRLYERAGWRDTGGRHPHKDDGLEMAEYERPLQA
jgi:ribosomal protein S18 acetylase RimI-like enzyme